MPPKVSLEDLTPEQLNTAALLYRSLLANPETRETTLRSTKKIYPDMAIPELDVDDRLKARDSKNEERLAALERQRLEDEVTRRRESAHADLRDKGYSKDQIAAIEKIMVDEHIPTHETARKFFDAQNRPATPTPDTGHAATTTFQMPENPLKAIKDGRFGLRDWARREANAALDDLRAGRVKLPA